MILNWEVFQHKFYSQELTQSISVTTLLSVQFRDFFSANKIIIKLLICMWFYSK